MGSCAQLLQIFRADLSLKGSSDMTCTYFQSRFEPRKEIEYNNGDEAPESLLLEELI